MSEQLEKRCSKCGIVKPSEQFSRQRQRNGQEGRRSQCKACIKAYDQANYEKVKAHQSAYRSACRAANYEKVRAQERERERRKRNRPEYCERQAELLRIRKAQNPEMGREYLLKQYNLTVQEYKQMYQAQNGLCAICGGPQIAKRRLSVDHDHATGIVRGLLCHRCNRGIGYFRENISFLENAITYLRSFQLDTDVS